METASQDKVTHKDLDRAADEATTEEVVEVEAAAEEDIEEEVEETTEEETAGEEEELDDAEDIEEIKTVTEPTDNAARTKLGRKVARQGEQLTDIQSTLDKLANFMEDQGEVIKRGTPDETDDEDAFLTPENLPKYLERENKKRETDQNKYQKKYTSEFANLGTEDENFDAIWAIMLDKHNTIETGDPVADAKINFYKAKAAFLENNRVTNPVKGKGSKTNTSVNLPNKMKGKTPVKVKLDSHAAEFVKKRGLSDEFVQKTLSKRG